MEQRQTSVLLEEFTIRDLERHLRTLIGSYKMANENFEFVTAQDLKEEIMLAKRTLKAKKEGALVYHN